jgi:hypothetical protein
VNIYAISCLSLAVVILYFPRGWLRLGKRVTPKPPRKYNQVRVEKDLSDNAVKPLDVIAKPRNWIDFVRGALGAATVVYMMDELLGATFSKDSILYINIGILLVSLIIQMIRMERRLSLFAPIFFLQGMAIGLVGPIAGLLAMVSTWAFSPTLPNANMVLIMQGAMVACITLLLPGTDVALALVAGGLTWLPAFVSLFSRRRLAANFDKKMKVIPRA